MNTKLYIYKLYQCENNDYDTFDSMVCTAPSEDFARLMHPYFDETFYTFGWYLETQDSYSDYKTWCCPTKVTVVKIGEAFPEMKISVVVSSFNAG